MVRAVGTGTPAGFAVDIVQCMSRRVAASLKSCETSNYSFLHLLPEELKTTIFVCTCRNIRYAFEFYFPEVYYLEA